MGPFRTSRSSTISSVSELSVTANTAIGNPKSDASPATPNTFLVQARLTSIVQTPLGQFLFAGMLLIIRDRDGRETGRLLLDEGCRVEITENVGVDATAAPVVLSTEQKEQPSPSDALGLVDDEATERFTVFAPGWDDAAISQLTAVLSADEKSDSVNVVAKLSDVTADDRDVVFLILDSKAFSVVGDYSPTALKNRKIIGIGYGAAKIFGELDLAINWGVCAHGVHGPPRIVLQPNKLLDDSTDGNSLAVFDPPVLDPENFHNDLFFGVYVGDKKPQRRDLVDVIALQTADKNYAPIVRQGNKVLACIDAPADKWSEALRKLMKEIATSLDAQRPQ